jgi:hypothetical protein
MTEKTTPPDELGAVSCSALEACKMAVSKQLMAALNGSDKTVRTDEGFIRWGLVEKRIHTLIEGYWPNNALTKPHEN